MKKRPYNQQGGANGGPWGKPPYRSKKDQLWIDERERRGRELVEAMEKFLDELNQPV